jgi:hypothetical protein
VTTIVPVLYPDGDASFCATARSVLTAAPWDFGSDEDIALMAAVLRRSYPLASVVVDRAGEPGSASGTFVGVLRDGASATASADVAWLSAVYDRAAGPAYRLTLRLLQDTARAQAVVEAAFGQLLHGPRADIEAAAASVYGVAFRLARAELRADVGPPRR